MAIIDVSNYISVSEAWSAASSGDTIVFPAGDWVITSPLKDEGRDNITVWGLSSSARLVGITAFQTLITISGRTGWNFLNLWLYGPGNGRRVTPDQEGSGIQ